MKKTLAFLAATLALLSLAAAPVMAQQASVRATAPTYTSGESRPLSMTTNAELRVTTGEGVGATTSDNLPQATTAGTERSLAHALGTVGWDRLRTVTGVTPGSGSGVLGVSNIPVSSSNTGIVGGARTSAGVALVLKASPGNFYDTSVVAPAGAGFVMVHNATAAPADGVVTPRFCAPVAANQLVTIDTGANPEWFSTGIVVVFSSTGCFTQTLTSAAFIRGRAL